MTLTVKDAMMRMPEGERLALAAILGLHDAKVPTRITYTHRFANYGDWRVPFARQNHVEQVWEIAGEISTAGGHTLANLRRGRGVKYPAIVELVAKHLDVHLPANSSLDQREELVVREALSRCLKGMSATDRKLLATRLEALGAAHGVSFASEGGALAAITAAHLSGITIYFAANAMVAGIAGALGVALPFSAYVVVTKAIAALTSPVAALVIGLGAAYKLGSPNMKKLVPSVLMIAAARQALVRGRAAQARMK